MQLNHEKLGKLRHTQHMNMLTPGAAPNYGDWLRKPRVNRYDYRQFMGDDWASQAQVRGTSRAVQSCMLMRNGSRKESAWMHLPFPVSNAR